MKRLLVLIMGLLIAGVALAYTAYPTEIPNKSFVPSSNAEYDFKYHGTPTYYWTMQGSNFTYACYFEPSKGNITVNFRIKIIGFMGYLSNGNCYIYVYLSETSNRPNDTPPSFGNKKYGPYSWHINNSYPNYDDCDVYAQNWYIKKSEIDAQPNKRFWVLWHTPSSPPPYPISDESTSAKNSYTYVPGTGWTTNISGYYPCWCTHCRVEYPPNAVENTSVGVVKALFN
ncbi:MAG: hypothetical protein ACUVWP_00590 [bacterium]